jgi:hypothetical protein
MGVASDRTRKGDAKAEWLRVILSYMKSAGLLHFGDWLDAWTIVKVRLKLSPLVE